MILDKMKAHAEREEAKNFKRARDELMDYLKSEGKKP